MAEGMKKKENNPRSVYADIIDLPHPVSAKHPQMSLHDRAAQFASYKALSGYEDMIRRQDRRRRIPRRHLHRLCTGRKESRRGLRHPNRARQAH